MLQIQHISEEKLTCRRHKKHISRVNLKIVNVYFLELMLAFLSLLNHLLSVLIAVPLLRGGCMDGWVGGTGGGAWELGLPGSLHPPHPWAAPNWARGRATNYGACRRNHRFRGPRGDRRSPAHPDHPFHPAFSLERIILEGKRRHVVFIESHPKEHKTVRLGPQRSSCLWPLANFPQNRFSGVAICGRSCLDYLNNLWFCWNHRPLA